MARPCIENYLRLIAQKAWSAWYRLPPHAKAWRDVDDLIQDGVLFARFVVLPRYRPHRAQFITLLSISLENYYKNLIFSSFTEKQNKCQTIPLCKVQYQVCQHDETEHEIKAVEGLMKIIGEASPDLKRSIHQWLFARTKTRCRGPRFSIVKSEFLELADKCGFTRNDFEYLLQNETWRTGMQKVQRTLR